MDAYFGWNSHPEGGKSYDYDYGMYVKEKQVLLISGTGFSLKIQGKLCPFFPKKLEKKN